MKPSHMFKKSRFMLAFMILFSFACNEDFLDLEPQQSVSDTAFLQSLADFQAAMIGGYDQMQLADWYGRYMLLVPDIMGDDVKQNASANRAKEWAEYNGSVATTHDINREFWAEIYEGINMANQMINSTFEPNAAIQNEITQLLGQAHALRGLAYFDLVRIFGQHYTFTADASHPGVPIVLDFDVTRKPARNTVAEVYAQIISDFQQAISMITVDPPNAGRFSKEAVQALLGRVYLYMEDYSNAEALATAVIQSGKYSLVSRADYPTQFFDGLSSEAILEIIFTNTDKPGSNHLGGMYKETGYGDYLPSQGLLDLMNDDDIRKTMFLVDPNLQGAYASLRVNKYPSSGSNLASDNIPVIRLSEVYLNRAEARAKLGNDAGAQEDLNLIRQRAWPTAPAITATGAALQDEIATERRIELCFEGHRLFDITRNKQNLVRTDCTSPVCTVSYPSDLFVLPIPVEEIDVNPNIAQNVGY
ncbi:RagB/SusD family nutrient uptake outer membrane protein [bacterium]|nr:RagB/SusD family nutrient uptake outer membrane protein [bacterium]